MKAVILAGGLGTRLKPFTDIIPKPLLPVGEKSILELQIEHLKYYGIKEIYLATNYRSEYIENFFGDGSRLGVNLYFSCEKMPLGTAGPLSLLKDSLQEPFLVINGDILSTVNFKKMFEAAVSFPTELTIGIKQFVTPFEFGNILYEGDYVTKVQEKPDLIHYILAGIYVMKPGIFKYIPEKTYFGVDHLIQSLLDHNQKVSKYEIKEYWLDVGRPKDYEKAQNEYWNQSYKE